MLGVGLRILLLGAACGLVYVGQKATYIVLTSWSDVELDAMKFAAMSHVALVLCAVLCITGATLPRWGKTAARTPALVTEYRTYRRLRALWTAVTDVCPNVVLGERRRRWLDAIDPRAIEFRLYRRIIEIRDAQLELRPYVDLDLVARVRAEAAAHGVRGSHLDALTEAAALGVAVERKRHAARIATTWTSPTVDSDGPTDLTSEAERLLAVSRYYGNHNPMEAAALCVRLG